MTNGNGKPVQDAVEQQGVEALDENLLDVSISLPFVRPVSRAAIQPVEIVREVTSQPETRRRIRCTSHK